MATNDVRVVGGAASGNVFSWEVDDRTASTINATIKPGEPVEAGGTGLNIAILLINGQPTVTGDPTRMIGIAHNESTETGTVNGEVNVEHIVPMLTVLEARMTTVGNVDTLAEWRLIQGDAVSFDAIAAITGDTGTTPYTVDEDEGDDPNDQGLVLVDWDPNRATRLAFVVKPLVTLFGNNL